MTATAPQATEKTQEKTGRDGTGRFAPGNAGGPGNPYARQVAEYKKAFLAFVTIEDFGRIVAAMKKKAEEGDVAAAKLILQYLLGRPTAAVDPDMLAVDEWQKLQQGSRPPREMTAVMNGVPAQVASDLTNVIWPCFLETNFYKPFQNGLKAMDARDAKRAAKAAQKEASASAAPKGNGDNGNVSEPAAPKPNGENGRVPEPDPMGNGSNGGYPDWWDDAVREVMEEIRREEGWPAPKGNGDNGQTAPRVP